MLSLSEAVSVTLNPRDFLGVSVVLVNAVGICVVGILEVEACVLTLLEEPTVSFTVLFAGFTFSAVEVADVVKVISLLNPAK